MVSFIFTLLAVTLFLQFADSRQCSYAKLAPLYEQKFGAMLDGDLLFEAQFVKRRNSGSYRFSIIRLWNDASGSIDLNDDMTVNVGENINTSIKDCFDELSKKDPFLLVLRKTSGGYDPLLAPLPITHKKHSKRQEIWSSWCTTSPENCQLKITRAGFPSFVKLERNQMVIISCRVSSMSPIASIRWLKDGKDVESHVGNGYAMSGLFVYKIDLEGGESDLVIAGASSLHAGTYSCIASDDSGETVEVKSKFTFHTDGVLTTCPAGKEYYCLSGSTCHGIIGIPGEAVCLCKPGHEGERCSDYEFPEIIPGPEGSARDQTDEIENLKTVTMILSVLVTVFGISLIVALVTLYRRKNRQKHARIVESPIESERTRSLVDPEAGTEIVEST